MFTFIALFFFLALVAVILFVFSEAFWKWQ